MAKSFSGVLAALAVGVVFGIGLAVSGMMNPAKVLGFLDFAGDWDPTLGLVMAGALTAAAPGFAIARKKPAPLIGSEFHIPENRSVDLPLVAGALLFGIGWGIVGFCPGPAIAAAGTGLGDVYVFVVAMIAGMALFRLYAIWRGRG
ncbi:MAG: DUF6691 family protein [Alphaproteobacteria bacterium]